MIKLSIFESGFFQIDGGSMFGLLPKTIWQKHYLSDHLNICQMAMRCLIYEHNDKIIIFDTGAPLTHDPRMKPYHFYNQKNIIEWFNSHNLDPQKVTDIIFSHIHFDHCGALTYCRDNHTYETFPNAIYHISEKQWNYHLKPNEMDLDAYFDENTHFLSKSNRLHLIKEDVKLYNDIELKLFDGHTPGQIVSFIQLPTETVVFAGDVIPTAVNLYKQAVSAFDLMPSTSITERKRLLEELILRNARVYFYHDAYTISGKVIKSKNFYHLKDVQQIGKENVKCK